MIKYSDYNVKGVGVMMVGMNQSGMVRDVPPVTRLMLVEDLEHVTLTVTVLNVHHSVAVLGTVKTIRTVADKGS